LAVLDQLAADLMCITERDSLLDEPLRDVRREREALRGLIRHTFGVETESRDHSSECGKQHLQRLDGVEDRLLVLLEVTVVRKRQTLESAEKPRQVADESPRLATRKLCDIGV